MRNLQLILSLFALFVITSCSKPEQPSCLSVGVDELISTEYVSSSETDIWSELKETGIVTKTGTDQDLRPQFVTVQFLVESTIASMLEQNLIKKAIAVIYTPQPPTPLRLNDLNISTLVSQEVNDDPERLNTVRIRHESLHRYLSLGGVLHAIRLADDASVPGIEVYKDNLDKYPNALIDHKTASIDPARIGASYLIECNNGQKVLFTITSKQINDTKDGVWALELGSVERKAELLRSLQALYAEHGVQFSVD
jgi:hypothetical protein